MCALYYSMACIKLNGMRLGLEFSKRSICWQVARTRTTLHNNGGVYFVAMKSDCWGGGSRTSEIKFSRKRSESTLLNANSYHLQFTKSFSSSSKESDQLVKSRSDTESAVSTSVAEKIKETTKTISYTGVVIVGFGIAFSIIYAIFSELFSSNSPHRIYSRAFDYVANDPRVQNVFGDGIKGFGEETRRGRRQHVSHVEYTKEDKNYLRMKFHIKGSRENGSVHLEMVANDQGNYEYRYLFAITDGVQRKTIILEDNRHKLEAGSNSASFPAISGDNFKELDLSLK